MNINIMNDLSTLTTIPMESLNKLSTKAIYCINDAVEELLLSDESILKLDIGIGILNISINNNELDYYFEPCDKLNNSIIGTIKNKSNTLTNKLDATLVDKVLHAYKDLL